MVGNENLSILNNVEFFAWWSSSFAGKWNLQKHDDLRSNGCQNNHLEGQFINRVSFFDFHSPIALLLTNFWWWWSSSHFGLLYSSINQKHTMMVIMISHPKDGILIHQLANYKLLIYYRRLQEKFSSINRRGVSLHYSSISLPIHSATIYFIYYTTVNYQLVKVTIDWLIEFINNQK